MTSSRRCTTTCWPAGCGRPGRASGRSAYANVTIGPGGLAETARAAAQVLSLPLYPEMPDEHVQQVAAAVRAFDR
ncbi:MAG: DegT/DnrJ/EryC1/StrS family aminotransferase [Chloroflexi bacterium]|nr:DegT/DnrJ/EryC1/StrS family aminotransferase [Chloroflexota bacterium]